MKFLGLGDNVIDYYINTGTMYPGGNAVNTAVHASKLGSEAAYLGNLGDDELSEVIRNALKEHMVDFSHCTTVKDGTTKCCDYTVTDGEHHFAGVRLGTNWSGPMILDQSQLEYMKDFDIIHSCCNAKMEADICKTGRLPAVLTYDFSVKDKYRTDKYLTLVCPYLDLALFSCEPMEEEAAFHFCRKFHEHGAKHVLITMGQAGSFVSNGEVLVKGEVFTVNPVDTMGAGDAFLTAFIINLASQGWKKGSRMTEWALKNALAGGARYAAENCMIKGGF
ncbi:PfkB family carbohydrate kinase [Lacrimispora sp.]|uniref:PfkB family carbohydrate kinase n=1 Tax=Lacrimispora sp. TaxID=2719234 RepID=UPI0028A208F0|nr:PfkB family carbohydrate kinase [Lacrimispora sp.]